MSACPKCESDDYNFYVAFDTDKQRSRHYIRCETCKHRGPICDAADEALSFWGKKDGSIPCVSCGKPSNTATADDADMCWECFGNFNATAYDNLKKRFTSLLNRDYPDVDIESALDELSPLPTQPLKTAGADLPFDPSDVIIQPYEKMTREELIACCHAHDAHHAEHHDKEAAISTRYEESKNLNACMAVANKNLRGRVAVLSTTIETIKEPLNAKCNGVAVYESITENPEFIKACEELAEKILVPKSKKGDAEDAAKWRALVASRMYCMGWAGLNDDQEIPDDGYRHITLNLWTCGDIGKTPHDMGYGWPQDIHGLEMLNKYIEQAVKNPNHRDSLQKQGGDDANT